MSSPFLDDQKNGDGIQQQVIMTGITLQDYKLSDQAILKTKNAVLRTDVQTKFQQINRKQQFRFIYKLRMTSSAHDACYKALDAIRSSHLDFYLQETPYSVFITIRKRFIKTFQPSNILDVVDSKVIENLTVENENLRTKIIETKAETESRKDEVFVLQNRLEKAEKYCEEEKNRRYKLTEEIKIMNLMKKKDNESISKLTNDLSKAKTEIKTLQKAIHSLEKKNENLKDKIENTNASKHEVLEDKKKITIENKNLKKKVKQLEEDRLSTVNSNNNSFRSSSIPYSNASTQTLIANTTSEKLLSENPLKCLICGKLCKDSNHLKEHSEADHELSIDIEKLTDPNEEDSTSRFLNSLIVDPVYSNERKKCFPEHWDHVCERIKVRMLAKMNFANTRDIIEENMKQIDVTKTHYSGKSFETSMLYLEKSLLCKWYPTIARQFMN